MKRSTLTSFAVFTLVGLAMPWSEAGAAGFSSGSTGADGAFNPASNVTLTLPPDGRFNFTTINIPSGVIVSFTRNSNNTPVYFLATGDVTINGTIDLSGANGGVTGDLTRQGLAGPGGFDGGRGGFIPSVAGGDGLGPGGGHGGVDDGVKAIGGGGGGYLVAGTNAGNYTTGVPGSGGPAYGSGWLQPLIGGSGGGGGSGSSSLSGLGGGGGGGGGGAILIASSGTIGGTGIVDARGGSGAVGGSAAGTPRCDSSGGGGSGGAVHFLATNVTFASTRVLETGGAGGGARCAGSNGGAGASGFQRFEILLGGTLDLGGGPTLAITSVAGIAAPATLTGYGDITIPTSTPNPVTVALTATNVPTGGTVTVTVTPANGTAVSVTSTPLAGTLASSTATASINVPNGLSSVQASTNYTVPLALVETLTRFAGEAVKSLKVTSVLNGGASKTLAVTASGREVEVPAAMLVHVALAPN